MDPNHDPNDASETIGLSLGLTTSSFNTKEKPTTAGVVPSPAMKFDCVLPCLSLGPTDCIKTSMTSNPEKDHEDDDEEEGSSKKKLKLTKDQSSVLEDAFKEHHSVNTNRKERLAKQLNLRPRQVEVWFQNRRARTRVKKTEGTYEILKQYCEKLKEENMRLMMEIHELKFMKLHATSGCSFPCPNHVTNHLHFYQ